MKPELLKKLKDVVAQIETEELTIVKDVPPIVKPVIRIPGVSLRYSTIDPWNSDRDALVLEHSGGTIGLHKGDGEFHMRLPGVNASSEIVWGADPHIFYYVDGHSVRQFDISKSWNVNAVSTIHTFSQYIEHDDQGQNGVRAMGEGDLIKGRYWALAGTLPSGEMEVFTFDCLTGAYGRPEKLPDVDGLYRTPDLNVMVTYHAKGAGRFQGVELFDKDMKFIHQVVTAFGHGDVGRDEDGDEVFVYCNSDDPTPIAPNAVVSVKLKDPNIYKALASFDWSQAMHVSCAELKPGVLLISTFDDKPGDNPKAGNDEVLLVIGHLSTSLGKHGSFGGIYEGQPQATISRNGTRYAFNDDADVIIGTI